MYFIPKALHAIVDEIVDLDRTQHSGAHSCDCDPFADDFSEDETYGKFEEKKGGEGAGDEPGSGTGAAASQGGSKAASGLKPGSADSESAKWQVCWHPTLEVSPVDGTEVTIKPMKQQQYFQDGHSVLRSKESLVRGLIKRVSQSVDVLVLPGSHWVLRDVPSERVETMQELDQHPGHYAIYKGWIGTVFGVWNKVRFRMQDGTEFSLTDEGQEFPMHFSEVLPGDRVMQLDSFQMYPGMKVRAPYFVLENAQWATDGFEPDPTLKEKMSLSREAWKQHDIYGESKWWTEEGDAEWEANPLRPSKKFAMYEQKNIFSPAKCTPGKGQVALVEDGGTKEPESTEDCVGVGSDSLMEAAPADPSEEKSVLKEDKSMLENDNSILKENKAALEGEKPLLKEDKSTLEEDKSMLKEGKCTLEGDESMLKEDKSALETYKFLLEENGVESSLQNKEDCYTKLKTSSKPGNEEKMSFGPDESPESPEVFRSPFPENGTWKKMKKDSDSSGKNQGLEESEEKTDECGVWVSGNRKRGSSVLEDGEEEGRKEPVIIPLEKKEERQEPLLLTVVQVDPAKMDVEWRSRVSGEEECEAPSLNILKEEHFKDVTRFRVPVGFVSPRSIGTKYSYKVQPDDWFLPIEEWRKEKLRRFQAAQDVPGTSASTITETQPKEIPLERTEQKSSEEMKEESGLGAQANDGNAGSSQGGASVETIMGLGGVPKPGEQCFVYLVTSESKVDVLWENGEMETGLEAESLHPSPCPVDLSGRDYFPGMYVLLRKKEEETKNRFGLVLRSNNAEKYGEIRWMEPKPVPESENTEDKLVLEKKATEEPPEFDELPTAEDKPVSEPVSTPNNQDMNKAKPVSEENQQAMLPLLEPDEERRKNLEEEVAAVAASLDKTLEQLKVAELKKPVFVGKMAFRKPQTPILPEEVGCEDVSFYDIKPHPEYNYLSGSLVSLLKRDTKNPEEPNIGYVMKKMRDGKVLVTWFNKEEGQHWPWDLVNLRADRPYVEGQEDDMTVESEGEDQNYNYYSPTDHEYDDVEDLRYFDYQGLQEEDRLRRIALMTSLLNPMLALLEKLIVRVHQHFPRLDRKQTVKLALHCDDVISGFAHLTKFKKDVEEFYKEKLGIEAGANSKLPGKMTPVNVSDDQLVWNIATWLYDWIEVTSELQAVVMKQKAKEEKQRLAGKTTENSDLPSTSAENSAVVADTESPTSPSRNNSSPGDENVSLSKKSEEKCESSDKTGIKRELAELSDWHGSIQTGFTTVGQILNQDTLSDTVIGLVMDCVGCLETALGREGEGRGLEIPEPDTEDMKASLAFMRVFMTNTKKISRLPCFSYTMPPERELTELAKQWESYAIGEGGQPFRKSPPTAGTDSRADNGPMKNVIESTTKLLTDLEKDNRKMTFEPHEMQPLINDVADSLCLSVVILLRAMTNQISKVLKEKLDELVAKYKERQEEANSAKKATGDAASTTPEDDSEPGVDGSGDCGESRGLSPPAGIDRTVSEDFGAALNPSSFEILESAPVGHRFSPKSFDMSIAPKNYIKAIRRELKLLESALPPGIFVKSYEDRMDLFSCMIVGPQGTPYADGLFFFDIRLKEDYPTRPPHVFYKSMSKRLNPNLYEDGMVCLSLLGTWDGKENELWTPTSTLLQVFLSIQSLVLVSEPYYNEPGYEKERGTEAGTKKSKEYNETAILLTLESIQKVLSKPHEPFQAEIRQHFMESKQRMRGLLERYQGMGEDLSYPLRPVTQGFCLCVKRHADKIRNLLQDL